MADELKQAVGEPAPVTQLGSRQFTNDNLKPSVREELFSNYFDPWGIHAGYTGQDIEYAIASKIFAESDLTQDDLMDRDTALYNATVVQRTINEVKVAYNTAFGQKLGKIQVSNAACSVSIPVQAIMQCVDIRLLRKGRSNGGVDNQQSNQYVIPEYDENGERTGLWKVFRFAKGEHGALDYLIKNICPGCNTHFFNDVINNLSRELAENAPKSTETFENYDYKLVPCYNGLVDRRDGKIRLTPWTDIDTMQELYPDLTMTYRYPFPYDPDAEKPDWNPIDFIKQLHDDKKGDYKELSIKITKQLMQFAIRGFSGARQWFVWLCNDQGRAKGQNGKSTLIDMIIYLMTLGMDTEDRVVTTNVDDMFSGKSNFAMGELDRCILHAGREIHRAVADMANFKQYIRCEYRLKVEAKYEMPTHINPTWCKMQALQGLPPIGTTSRDKSEASFTHQIYLTFNRDFSGDKGDPRVQSDYIKDKKVLTYLMKELIEMPFDDDYDGQDIDNVNAPVINRVFDENITSFEIIDEILDDLLPSYGYPLWNPTCGIDGNMLWGFYQIRCELDHIKSSARVEKKKFYEDLEEYCKRKGDGEYWEYRDEVKRTRYSQNEKITIGIVKSATMVPYYQYARDDKFNGSRDPLYPDSIEYVQFKEAYLNKLRSTVRIYALPDNPYYDLPEQKNTATPNYGATRD